MVKTLWGEPLRLECAGKSACGSCPICRAVAYNETVTGLTALERPGSDAYLAAVMGQARRAAARPSRWTVAPAPSAGRAKVRVERRPSDRLAPQLCAKCDRRIVDQDVWAHDHYPLAVHVGCAPENVETLRDSDGGWVPARVGAEERAEIARVA